MSISLLMMPRGQNRMVSTHSPSALRAGESKRLAAYTLASENGIAFLLLGCGCYSRLLARVKLGRM
jgi:hypothetical protein